MRLANRTALVTGAGRGIGEAIARAYAAEGARVCLVARTGAELERVAAAIRSRGGEAAVAAADIADADQIDRAVRTCEEALGAPDILVNVAGVYGPIGPLWEVDLAGWRRALDINVMGTVHCCRAVLPAMIRQRRGRIINFSGGGATSPLPQLSAYAASKAAVVRFTETLAQEVVEHGIAVNAIAPGAVDTRLQDEVLEAGTRSGPLYERVRRLRETGEGGVPAELPAALAVFLASDAAGSLTGKLISAPHDGWREWDQARITELEASAWFTLRRLDAHTLGQLIPELREVGA